MDAYTFITRGKVLANAQTGNIVYLCNKFRKKRMGKILWLLYANFIFALGILFTELIKRNLKSIRFSDGSKS